MQTQRSNRPVQSGYGKNIETRPLRESFPRLPPGVCEKGTGIRPSEKLPPSACERCTLLGASRVEQPGIRQETIQTKQRPEGNALIGPKSHVATGRELTEYR